MCCWWNNTKARKASKSGEQKVDQTNCELSRKCSNPRKSEDFHDKKLFWDDDGRLFSSRRWPNSAWNSTKWWPKGESRDWPKWPNVSKRDGRYRVSNWLYKYQQISLQEGLNKTLEGRTGRTKKSLKHTCFPSTSQRRSPCSYALLGSVTCRNVCREYFCETNLWLS